jgi:energy-coupling factor transporter transmembrane protein EcfT
MLITRGNSIPLLGSLAHLAIFTWTFLLVASTGGVGNPWALLFGFVWLAAIYPKAIKRLLRMRWVVLFASLFIVSVLFGPGEPDLLVWGAEVSTENLVAGFYMICRALLILLAADGLAASIDITEVAGLFEGVGFSGLGFSLGVAVNLIPNIQESVTTTWHALRMRGGLRAKWWRGLQLFALTVLTNSLRRSEDIVLAAEVRAFSPERSRRFHLRIGRLDWLIVVLGLTSITLLVVIL